MSARVPDLFVERLAAGALDETRAADVRARLEAEPGGLERLAAIESSNAEILRSMPPRVFAAAVQGRLPPARRRWELVLVPALLAAAVLMVAVPTLNAPGTVDPGLEITRAKGDPELQLHRRGEEAPLDEGVDLRAGDLVQVSYTASGAAYGAIVSIDGRGTVTWHLPERGGRAVKLLSGGGVPLDHGYELDDAPDFERFLFVTGSHAFDLDAVEAEVRAWTSGDVKDLELEPSLRTTLFTIGKEGRR